MCIFILNNMIKFVEVKNKKTISENRSISNTLPIIHECVLHTSTVISTVYRIDGTFGLPLWCTVLQKNLNFFYFLFMFIIIILRTSQCIGLKLLPSIYFKKI